MMDDPEAALRARVEEMVRLVRDPRQWGMGREYELRDVFDVWAWAEAHQETALMAALARVVALQHIYRVGVTAVDPTWAQRFEAFAAEAQAVGDETQYADWLEGLLYFAPHKDLPAQRRLMETLEAIYARLGNTPRRVWHLHVLVGITLRQGDPQAAWRAARTGYRLSHDSGDVLGVGLIALNLAHVLEKEDRAREAGRLLYATWHALREAGSLFGITARDTLRTLQDKHDLSNADVATESTLEALMAALCAADSDSQTG